MTLSRLTVLIDPAQKVELARRAVDLGVSLGEYVRRGALAYDPRRDAELAEADAMLGALADVYDGIAARAEAIAAGQEALQKAESGISYL